MKFVKIPVTVEAVQYTGSNIKELKDFAGDAIVYREETDIVEVVTLEGNVVASKDDFIIKGVKGEFYPCKPDIFMMTYEPAK